MDYFPVTINSWNFGDFLDLFFQNSGIERVTVRRSPWSRHVNKSSSFLAYRLTVTLLFLACRLSDGERNVHELLLTDVTSGTRGEENKKIAVKQTI